VFYLTVLSLVDYSTFFLVIACTAIIGFVSLLFLQEPKGHMAEVNADGTVELIKVS
jgi:MFS transporter, NNP family, nitrate/nitrite transporter